jgi:hypothetical protein
MLFIKVIGVEPPGPSFDPVEEQWFAAGEPKRPFRVVPTAPPPPIGDPLADAWFR